MTESAFQSQLLAALGPRNYLTLWRQMCGTAYVPRGPKGKAALQALVASALASVIDMGPPNGAADLTGITSTGKRLEIEVKGPDTRITPEQVRWGEFIRSQGGVYVLARSPGLQQAIADVEAQL